MRRRRDKFARVRLSAAAVIAVGVAVGAFASASSASSSGAASLKGKTICYVSPANIDVMNEMFNVITDAAKNTGTKVNVVNAEGNFSQALAETQQFVASGECDAIGVVTALTTA